MDIMEAREEYIRALKAGQKEEKELLAAGKDPHPAVLDDILPAEKVGTVLDIGMVEIPTKLIVGTKATGRVTAFSASFLPLPCFIFFAPLFEGFSESSPPSLSAAILLTSPTARTASSSEHPSSILSSIISL
jgi:hypothetical protein